MRDTHSSAPDRLVTPSERGGTTEFPRAPRDEEEREAVEHTGELCSAEAPGDMPGACTRSPGHSGDHVSAQFVWPPTADRRQHIVSRWPQSALAEPPPAPVPGGPEELPAAGVTSMESIDDALLCGRHSGIPECCIAFYNGPWREWLTSDPERHDREEKMRRWRKAQYVECPECIASGAVPVELRACPDPSYCVAAKGNVSPPVASGEAALARVDVRTIPENPRDLAPPWIVFHYDGCADILPAGRPGSIVEALPVDLAQRIVAVANGVAAPVPGGTGDDLREMVDALIAHGPLGYVPPELAKNARAAASRLAADNAALTARVAAAEGEREKHWNALCRVVEALGKVAPEAAPYAEGWARKVREERDSLRADLQALTAGWERARADELAAQRAQVAAERERDRAIADLQAALADVAHLKTERAAERGKALEEAAVAISNWPHVAGIVRALAAKGGQ